MTCESEVVAMSRYRPSQRGQASTSSRLRHARTDLDLAGPGRDRSKVPLAWKRPADDLLTKGGPPSLCKAVNLIAANLSNASGIMCDQIRGAQTDEITNLPATPNCAK